MAHARLLSLQVKALRSFVTLSEVNFPESGMMLFRGKNLDSGGSSGSGKSSLLLAITYLLGFCRFPATALQSWLTEEPMEVSAVFAVTAGELRVSRGQGLKLELNGKAVKGSAKQLEEKLSAYIGLGPELLAALTYRGQKQPGLFLSKTDSEKKEFLTLLLDLGRFEAQYEASSAKIKLLEQKHQQAGGVVHHVLVAWEAAKAGRQPAVLTDELKLKSNLKEALAHQERIQAQITSARLTIASFNQRLEDQIAGRRLLAADGLKKLEERVKALEGAKPDYSQVDNEPVMNAEKDLEQAHAYLNAEQEADKGRWLQQRRDADSVHAQLLLIEKRLAAKPGLERKIASLRTEISKLEASVCPTCDRTWELAEQKKNELQVELKASLSDYQVITSPDPKPEIDRLRAEYRRLGNFEPSPMVAELRGIVEQCQKTLNEANAKVALDTVLARKDLETKLVASRAQLNVARGQLEVEIGQFRSQQQEGIVGTQDELESLEREEQMIRSQIDGVRAALNRVQIDNAREQARVAALDAEIERLDKSYELAVAASKEVETELNAELDFQRLIGREGFLGAIFDEVLWEISEETNRLLAQFPNTAHVTLHFRSESTTGKGTIKKEIKPVVSIGGFEAPLSAGLSGGMETAVELAVDLAVATVVSRRTGSAPGWLILDESFTGLGPVEAEASMEILRAFAEDKLVLVVDHASEFKSMFTQFVDVEYKAGQSRVVQS